MTVLHVVYECIPGSFAGGVQKMVLELAKAQGKQGDTVEIWTIGPPRVIDYAPGLKIRYFRGRVRWGSADLRRTLLAEHARFAVIHSHNTFLPLNRAVAAAAARGARVFFHAHGTMDPVLLGGLSFKAIKKRLYVAALERRNYDSAAGVFGLTRTECHQLELMGTRAAIFEVSNGIDQQSLPRPAAPVGFRLRLRLEPHQPMILFIGRITHKKGIHYLLDALSAIRREVPGTVLVICGGRDQDREYVASLDAQIARLGLESQVRWAGFANEEGKRAAFAACTVFAHPSYSEGMAMAVLESMSAGIPTVVTPGCYMESAVDAGAVCLSEQAPDKLAAAVVRLLRQPDEARALGIRGKEYVADHHSWSGIAARLSAIYAGQPGVRAYRERKAG